jgi:hypothetical protein
MPMRDSRRQRQQLIDDGDAMLLAREEVTPGDDEDDELELELEESFVEVLSRC